jgi:hypothetical protein
MAEIGALSEPPVVRPRDSYPESVNVEFVKITDGNSIQMRGFERGSGETRSWEQEHVPLHLLQLYIPRENFRRHGLLIHQEVVLRFQLMDIQMRP